MATDTTKLLDDVLRISRADGDAIMEIYQRDDFSVETKAYHSPLTEADRAAHELISAELARLTPAIPVWSEESATIPFDERSGWDEFWLVDPLDGTKEFIKRNGEFTVNIALIREHLPVLGLVHAPARGVDYYASRTAGAWRQDGAQAAQRIEVRRPAAEPARVVGSRSHRGASLEHFLTCIGPHELVPMGSSLKLCLVASGDADVYPRLGPTSEWDTAAAQAVVECAGGVVVDLQGRPLRYNHKAEVLNPYFIVYGDPGPDWLACADSAQG